MSNRLLMSVAVAALIAGAGVSNAQAPAPGGAAGGAPPPAAGGMSGGAAGGGAAGGSMSREAPAARGDMKGGETGRGTTPARDQATEQRGGDKMDRNADTKNGAKDGAKDMNRNADTKDGAKDMNRNADTKDGAKDTNRNAQTRDGADKAGATTGQAGAGAKLTTEQRTKVTTVIKQQNVQPVTNINFSISVGTRVPRDITFRPVPTEIITIYPAWRGYQFFLARNEIIIVDPATFEIVAVLPA